MFGDSRLDASFGGTQTMAGMSHGGSGSTMNKPIQPPRSDKALLPVTVSQICNVPLPEPDSAFMIDGVEADNVRVVAQVVEKRTGDTATEVILSDDSGDKLKMKVWCYDRQTGEMHSVNEQITPIEEGDWIQVIGRINIFREDKLLNPFNVVRATELVVRHHKLHARYVQLYNTKVRGKGMSMAGGSTSASSSVLSKSAVAGGRDTSMAGISSSAQPGSSQFDIGIGQDDGDVSAHAKQVMDCIKANRQNSGPGISLDTICHKMPLLDKNDVRAALEELINEGTVFSTVDEEHFQATE